MSAFFSYLFFKILVVLHTNTTAITIKVEELQKVADCNNVTPIFLCVTESWLSSQIHDPAVAIPGHNLFRKDCTSGAGGGVCVSFLKNLFLVLDWTSVISLTVSLCGFL